MSMARDQVRDIIADLIRREGGYVNHPSDKGGPTKYGITEKVARGAGYKGRMEDLPIELAERIYTEEYWIKPGFARVAEISLPVAIEALDAGVLSSPLRAAKWLQLALNRLNMRELLYPDLTKDGLIGPKTLNALRDYMRHRKHQQGELILLRAMNCLQGHFLMITAVEHHQPNEDFVFGWLKHRVVI
jgi:lysozyme family protein